MVVDCPKYLMLTSALSCHVNFLNEVHFSVNLNAIQHVEISSQLHIFSQIF